MKCVSKSVLLAAILAVASPVVCCGDSGLFWLYQYAGGIASISVGQTALAMGGSKSWPVVFAPSASNPYLTQTLALGAFRSPVTNTYWTNRGQIGTGLPFGNFPILTAKSTSLGQIGFAMSSSSISAAYIGTRESGLTEITNGAFGLAVNSKQQLVAPNANWLAGSGLSVAAARGVALDPWDNLGLTVADPSSSSSLAYYEKNSQSGWQSVPLGYSTMSSINYYADIAYDGSGSPVIAYNNVNSIWAANFDIRSGQWQSVSLGAGSLNSATLYPTIATDSKGGVGVSWVASSGSSTLMYAYKPRDAGWKVYPVTSSVSVPLSFGSSLVTEPVRAQTRVGLDFDSNDLPVISFMGTSGRVYLAYDPVLTPSNVPDTIRAVGDGQQQVDSSFVTGAVRLVKQGPGTLVREGAANNMFGTLIEAGTLVVNGANAIASGPVTVMPNAVIRLQVDDMSGSTLEIQAGAVLDVGVDGPAAIGKVVLAAGGKVDVHQALVTTILNDASAAEVVRALQTGRGDGSWNGTSGITSSAAASSSGTRTVGWLDNGDGSVTFGYAAAGDANLDWTIDIIDIANFIGSGKFNSGLTATWAEGDFNYDGFADITDIADFMSSGLFNAGPYNSPAGTIAAVPEPSTLGVFGVGAGIAGLVAMRRKRAR